MNATIETRTPAVGGAIFPLVKSGCRGTIPLDPICYSGDGGVGFIFDCLSGTVFRAAHVKEISYGWD